MQLPQCNFLCNVFDKKWSLSLVYSTKLTDLKYTFCIMYIETSINQQNKNQANFMLSCNTLYRVQLSNLAKFHTNQIPAPSYSALTR